MKAPNSKEMEKLLADPASKKAFYKWHFSAEKDGKKPFTRKVDGKEYSFSIQPIAVAERD